MTQVLLFPKILGESENHKGHSAPHSTNQSASGLHHVISRKGVLQLSIDRSIQLGGELLKKASFRERFEGFLLTKVLQHVQGME